MRTKDILEAMSNGAILCAGYAEWEKHYWLEPGGVIIRPDIAEDIIKLPGVEPNKDGVFGATQTWRVVGGAKKKIRK